MNITMKVARVGAGLTQQEVADKLGVHVQTYTKYEAHNGEMPLKIAKRFADIVGVDFADIFLTEESKKNRQEVVA
ncbi:MAG: helix-turn-helix transcriptional regulator [Clostridiales bacterium]|nr:helix-turn-helix transcriptional regulator [Clostridiales bacterium]